MDYIGLTAIVKDETPYIREWVAHYKILGLSRIIIYDNGSAIPVKDTLADFIASNFVTVIAVSASFSHLECYNDAIERFQKEFVWMAFFDADEFLVPKKTDNVNELLAGYEKFRVGGLGVNWLMFGSSGLTDRHRHEPVLTTFTKCSYTTHINTHIKSIVRLNRVRRVSLPHCFYYKLFYRCVNEKFKEIKGALSAPASREVVQLNHYFTKSFEEFKEKIARGKSDCPGKRNIDIFYDHDFKEDEDFAILRFVDKVRKEFG